MEMTRRRAGIALGVVLTASATLPLIAGSASAGGGCHRPTTEGSSQVVSLVNACFDQTITRVPVGTRVTWVNKDPLAHVVVGQGFHWGTEAQLQQGDRFSTIFRVAGIHPYTCWLHPGMNGAVVVGDVDAPELDSISGSPVSDSAITREAPAPKAAAKSLSARPVVTRTSAGPWPATTAIGFVLALVFGIALITQLRGLRRRPEKS